MEVDIKLDAEVAEGFLDLPKHEVDTAGAEHFLRLIVREGQRSRAPPPARNRL